VARTAAPDKKVFPKFDVVGWYSTGAELQDADLELQRTVRALTGLRAGFAPLSLASCVRRP
jgi:hypothetical protein